MPGRGIMNNVEVFTRKPCPYYACVDGKDTENRKSNKTFEECETCNGKGYIESWENLKDLLSCMINIGGQYEGYSRDGRNGGIE